MSNKDKAAPVGEREAFEAWAIQEIGKSSCPDRPEWAVEKNSFGHYASVTVQGAWIGYQAGARAARSEQK